MKRVPPLDFLSGAPRPWPGLLLCGAALIALAAAGASSWQAERRNREASALIAERLARSAPAAPQRLSEAERLRLVQTERLAGELRAPWAELLATFEEHGRADIGLLKLEPDARAGVVRITGHAKDVKALFAYLLALEADGRLADVALANHQAERDVPGQPLRFTIQAAWRPGTVTAAKGAP